MPTKNPQVPQKPVLALSTLLLTTSFALVATTPLAAASPWWEGDVPGTGEIVAVALDRDAHLLEVTGTYAYGQASDQLANAKFVVGGGICSNPHVDPLLELLVNGQSPWQDECRSNNTYTTIIVCPTVRCDVTLQIDDVDYRDNSGALHVTITSICGAYAARDHAPGAFAPPKPLLEYRFGAEAHLCEPKSASMKLDGQAVPAALSPEPAQDGYALTYQVPAALSLGLHTVDVTVTNPEGNVLSDSWTFTVCDEAPLVATYYAPTGSTGDSRPIIESWFPNQYPCGVLAGDLYVNGMQAEEARVTHEDGYSKITYLPPSNLPPGTYTVQAIVKEECCDSAGRENAGSITWTFSLLAGVFGDSTEFDEYSYGYTQTIRTPDAVENEERICHPATPPHIACLEEFRQPIPHASATVGVEPVHVSGTFVPSGQQNVTGSSVGPVSFCNPHCTLPAPMLEEPRAQTQVTLYLALNDEPALVNQTIPINLP